MTNLDKAFNRFHLRNPSIYAKLRELALRLMKALFEILRFNSLLQHDEKLELNNSYAPYYARMLMMNEPKLTGFFRTRTLTSK